MSSTSISKILKIYLPKYASLYGNGNSDFHIAIREYESTKQNLKKLLQKIGAGKGKGFAIARTMNIDAFCEYIENPKNDFANRIKTGDVTLVHDLSFLASGQNKKCFSAATKICTLWWESLMGPQKHAPFVIADSFVRDALINLNNTHKFTTAKIDKVYQHADFPAWYKIITEFRNAFNLDDFSERDIDKSLWVLWNEFTTRPLDEYITQVLNK